MPPLSIGVSCKRPRSLTFAHFNVVLRRKVTDLIVRPSTPSCLRVARRSISTGNGSAFHIQKSSSTIISAISATPISTSIHRQIWKPRLLQVITEEQKIEFGRLVCWTAKVGYDHTGPSLTEKLSETCYWTLLL